MQLVSPVTKQAHPLAGVIARLVGEIVRGAREGIDRRHVRPQLRRQQSRGDRKVFVMQLRDLFAMCIGRSKSGLAYHGVSGEPARWLAARAIVKSRSDSRFR